MNARPDSPSAYPQLTRLGFAFLAVALVALRKSDSLINPQFWAEDGALFFIEAERYGGWNQLFRPYEGYLHLIPRLIAALGSSLSLPLVPGFYAWSALAATGVIAWWLQSPRLRLPGGVFAAVALATVPHTGEAYLTICNLQWITALGLFSLTFATDAPTPTVRVGELALLIFTGLTGPFVLLALPLFAWRACAQRSRWSYVLIAVAFACACAHVPSLLARAAEADPATWAPWHHAAIIGRRVIGTLFLGQLPLSETICAVLAISAFTALAGLLWRRRSRLPGGLVLLSSAVLVLAATGYKVRPDTWTLSELTNGDRYFFIPKVIVIWLLVALALTGTPRLRFALFGLLGLALISNAPRFLFPPAPDQNWRASCELIARGQPVWVPILPAGTAVFHSGHRHP